MCYFIAVLYKIRSRVLRAQFIIWLMLVITILFQMGYCMCFIYPSQSQTYEDQLSTNVSKSNIVFQVFGFSRLTCLQLTYLVLSYMYYEVKVKFEKINLLRSEEYYASKLKRKAILIMSALAIVLANVFYRICWYDPL